MTTDSEIGATVARHARTTPDGPAILSPEGTLTYGGLSARAGRYREAMDAAGLRAGDVVAMMLPDGPDAIAALVAAFSAGLAFVWLDEDQPRARHQVILRDCAPVGLITDGGGLRRSVATEGCPILVTVAGDTAEVAARHEGGRATAVPPNTSCLIYTSGSTGRPKGIALRGGNLTHFSRWLAQRNGIGPGSRMLQWARLSYDAGYLEILGALDAGATLVIPSSLEKPDGARIRTLVIEHEPSHVFAVPTLIRRLLLAREEAADGPAAHVRAVTLYGEPLHGSLVSRVRTHFPAARIYNLYGPAESTVATFHPVPEGHEGDVPIGADIDGIETLLRDADGAPVPDGESGEVWLRSRFLANGYVGRPEETRAAFLPLEAAFPGGTGAAGSAASNGGRDGQAERIYRTGDVARRLPDGSLLFLGRGDAQVKIRGARVELAEIEAALFTDPAVAQAGVGVHVDESGTAHPVAYLEPRPGATVEVSPLHRRLVGMLPAFMVPAAYILVDRLPTTSTGKIDRKSLPDPRPYLAPATGRAATAAAEPSGAAGPGGFSTDTERRLAAIWRRVLNVAEIGPDDDFFALKGHSLLAVRITAAVIEEFGAEIPVRAVFEHPTVFELAARVDEELAGTLGDENAAPAAPPA
ncbi:non-ribosomal peptide synthetase [Actinomadura roseirufa]|uniref:non-ribosomal peptide synthetase n=1 Tax=Actinomadura roseirufa TaxID=2094049 RepID=UPI00104128F9|nr:non-ribosomal peptide synthetase [Actinomadura roseirufa]